MHHPFEGHHHPNRHLHEHLRDHLRSAREAFGEHGFPAEGPGFRPGPGFRGGPGLDFRGGFPPNPPGPPGFGADFGPGPAFGGFGFGPQFGGFGRGHNRGHGRGGHGRGRARRGNVRSAVLMLLTERPMHGYEIIQQISERSHGWWRPSPGSVYPTLQLLADEGLITTDQDSQSPKRLYTLTDDGRTAAEQQDATPPWEQAADDVNPDDVALQEALSTLMGATMQLSAAGTPDLRAKAAKLLVETRRQLYLLLADAGTTEDTVEDAPPADEG
jgi:DNA-binding PadR family transcriptional regulator